MADLRFDGKVAVITGGGGAIGKAHATALGQRGATIVLLDFPIGPFGERGTDPGERERSAADELCQAGLNAIALTADVTSDTQVRMAVASVIERFGRIDILVCSAGTAGVDDVIELAPAEGLDRQLDIHLRGSLISTRAVWPHMLGQGGGHILLTGSAACLGMPQEQGHYAAGYPIAKAALIGAMRQLSGAGQVHGIKVNLLMPWAYSRLLASAQSGTSPIGNWMQRTMSPDQVAAGALFLLHEDCPATGEVMSAGGGRVARMVTAMPPGYVNDQLTPEQVRDNWDQVLGQPGDWIALSSFTDEWAILQQFLGSPFD